ncbi:amino acid synthesis family protein [Alkalicella caledoniensis]|uniref:Amino acid synthesis family protein n=1 Tax=Alkalicella caledoniensis TaxID=2731377 RepID=A0A7G9WB40_ALKCA|nr:amino acid synthesis family protein [Alkalicella caledoniensis]QNO15902.1 amino acid synthesis family protein [Alkalicella caledoniensis]
MKIRKFYTIVEEPITDGQKLIEGKNQKKVSVAVVIENPFAGKYQEDLSSLADWSEEIAPLLVEKALKAANIDISEAESYGKAAIVGGNGELEHAAALLHPKLGKPFREGLGGGKSIIPSAKKMGYPGVSIDVPLHYKDAAFVRTHFDAMEVRVPDAPRDNELVLIVSVTNCGRPHPRVGGLTIAEAKCVDGLR